MTFRFIVFDVSDNCAPCFNGVNDIALQLDLLESNFPFLTSLVEFMKLVKEQPSIGRRNGL